MKLRACIGLGLCFGLLLTSCRHEVSVSTAIGEFRSKIPARATRGGPVDGAVYYKVYKAVSSQHGSRVRPIERCILQHGYGITQDALKLGKKVGHDSVAGKLGYDALDFFASLYFGKAFIHQLLTSACDEVYVTVQESNNTTLLEMTRRTEALLREEICNREPARGKSACALIGHSKGGAVAFSIARRCMQESSTMGEAVCRRIKKIYSATGVIQGAIIPALLYGAKKLDEKQVFGFMDALASQLSIKLSKAGSVAWDLNSNYVSGITNPTWFDLSPATPMEGNIPLYFANDVALQKKGWLGADFGASATDFNFDKLNLPKDLDLTDKADVTAALDFIKWDGCGDRAEKPTDLLEAVRWGEQNLLCHSFGRSLILVHSLHHRKTFEHGVKALASDMVKYLDLRTAGGDLEKLKDKLTWENFQTGDGFADKAFAIDACEKGKRAPNSAITRCTIFNDLNHHATAGGAKEAADDMVAHLSR